MFINFFNREGKAKIKTGSESELETEAEIEMTTAHQADAEAETWRVTLEAPVYWPDYAFRYMLDNPSESLEPGDVIVKSNSGTKKIPRQLSEKDITRFFQDKVLKHGVEARKINWENRRGAPDWAVFANGKTYWVELKRPGGKASPAQKLEHSRLNAQRVSVDILESTESVEEFFRRLREDNV